MQVCPYPALEVEEEVWLNKKEKCLHLHCYNLTWSKYAFLEEYSCYRACDSNPDWLVLLATIKAILFQFLHVA